MTKLLKIFLVVFFGTGVGLFAYQQLNTKTTVADWEGSYESIKPNFIEGRFLWKKYKVKEGLYPFSKSKYIHLKKDYTFEVFEILSRGDTLHYRGTWQMVKEKPLLHFKNEDRQMEVLSFTNKVYYIDYLIPCQDTTQRIIRFNLFKKIE